MADLFVYDYGRRKMRKKILRLILLCIGLGAALISPYYFAKSIAAASVMVLRTPPINFHYLGWLPQWALGLVGLSLIFVLGVVLWLIGDLVKSYLSD